MKILGTADWHIGESSHILGEDYLERQLQMLRQIENIASLKSVDVIVLAGDIFHKPHVKLPQREKDLFLAWLLRVLNAKIHIVIISGNHDKLSEIYTSLHYIKLLEADYEYLHVAELQSELFLIKGAYFAAIPADLDFKRHVGKLWRLADQDHDCFITVGHGPFRGSTLDSGRSIGELEMINSKHVDLQIFGDIHKQQRLGPNAWMCGAPIQHNWGDKADTKGVLIFDTEKDITEPESLKLEDIKEFVIVKSGEPIPENAVVKLLSSDKIENLPSNVVDVVACLEDVDLCESYDLLDGLPEFLLEKGFDQEYQKQGIDIVSRIVDRVSSV